jgi:tripartite-type tricarboxylate transporter receptor subunit TctC
MNFFHQKQPTNTLRRHALGALAVLIGSLSMNLGMHASAGAQTAPYPTKSITMIVPFPPGGLADIVARPVAEALTRELGQPVVIENKGGAGGGIGMGVAARAKPDGYTVLLALSSLTVIPEADALLGRSPMFLLNELRPIARYTADPTVLAVRADAPWKTVKEFIEDARKRPGAINYGSSGNYGTMHVPMEILAQTAGVKMTHIPFTGAAPAIVAMLGGQIDAVSTGPATVLQHVKAGKIRVLGHWGNGPLASLPDVSSLKDLGFNAESTHSGLACSFQVARPSPLRSACVLPPKLPLKTLRCETSFKTQAAPWCIWTALSLKNMSKLMPSA